MPSPRIEVPRQFSRQSFPFMTFLFFFLIFSSFLFQTSSLVHLPFHIVTQNRKTTSIHSSTPPSVTFLSFFYPFSSSSSQTSSCTPSLSVASPRTEKQHQFTLQPSPSVTLPRLVPSGRGKRIIQEPIDSFVRRVGRSVSEATKTPPPHTIKAGEWGVNVS